jgi:hypothetical protein
MGRDTARPLASTNQGVVGIAPGSRRCGLHGFDRYYPPSAGDTVPIGAARVGTNLY